MRWGILGPLLVTDDTGRVVALPAGRLRVLLAALLARANHVVSLDELVEIVWDAAPPAGASRSLRVYVVRLRHVLGPALSPQIITRPPGYLCEAAEDELDLLRFEALCHSGEAAVRAAEWPRAAELLSQALELWRGPALFDVPSDLLREQCVPRLERLHVQALEEHAEAELHLGRAEQLVPRLRDLIASHPLREHLHAQLMRALSGCGRRAEALEAYQDARRILVGQLGIEPGAELRELHRRVLVGEADLVVSPAAPAVPSTAVPRQLPAAVRHFVGRAAELKALSELSGQAGPQAGTVAVSVICGAPGVGKTALAVHFAHQCADRFPDGQLYADLRGFDPAGVPADVSGVVRRFLDALAVPSVRIPSDLDAQLALYRSTLADKRVLIVLDNARDENQVRPLLPGSAGCLVVVTSRDQLTGLVALDGASPLTLDLFSHDEAHDLLARRLGHERVVREQQDVTLLIDLCARLPLALNIAAARAALHADRPLSTLSYALRDARRRLDLLCAGNTSTNIRAVFSCSYRALTPDAARIFRLLDLHPSPDIGVAAAASLAGADPYQVRRALDELTTAHLLTEHLPGRYGLHDLLRVYAAELIRIEDGDGAKEDATRRMFDHYLHTAYGANRLLNPTRAPISLAPPQPGVTPERFTDLGRIRCWYRREHSVLLAVVALAARNGYDAYAWQIPWTIADYLQREGHWRDQIDTHRSALATAVRLNDVSAQAYAYRVLGRALTRLGSYDDAATYLHRALELHRQANDRTGQAAAHRGLAWVYERQDRIEPALDHAELAVELFRSARDRGGMATALNAAAWLHTRRGDYDRAIATCRQALRMHRHHTLGDPDIEANTWVSLGYAYHHQGRYTQAIACYRRALPMLREHGMRYFEADALVHLGDAHHEAGDQAASRSAWNSALDIFADLDHPDAEAVRVKLRNLDADPA